MPSKEDYVKLCERGEKYFLHFENVYEVDGKRKQQWSINPLNANPTKWSNTLKQFVRNLPSNYLSVFDHFVRLTLEGLKVLTNNMTNSIVPVNEKTLNSLKRKHPQLQPACEETPTNSELPLIYLIIFDSINKELLRKAAIRTTGGSGLSGLEGDNK